MAAKRTYLGKNNVTISGVINKVNETEVAGYRVVSFNVHCTHSYFNKHDNETKSFTQRIPCKFWDKAGTAPIEPGWYVHIDGQIASDNNAGIHVKARNIDRVFEDQTAIDDEYAVKQKQNSTKTKTSSGIPPIGDEDIPF